MEFPVPRANRAILGRLGPAGRRGFDAVMVGVLVQLQGRWVTRDRAEGQTFAQANQLLQTGQFDQAQVVVAAAARRGIESGRQRGIQAEAIRGIPNVLALAVAGRLSDFGCAIGGVTAHEAPLKGTKERAYRAYELLARSPSDEVVIGLNRQRFLLILSCERKTICNMLFGNWLWQQTRSSYCTLSMLLVL